MPMTVPVPVSPTVERPQRRLQCAHCLRPQRDCMCAWVRPVHTLTQVLILQHPAEVTHAKNTARLLHLSLGNSRLCVGDTWDDRALATAGVLPSPLDQTVQTWLLYPKVPQPPASDADLTANSNPVISPGTCADGPSPAHPVGLTRLVVLDGTWRQSRHMLRTSAWLQALPVWSLDEVPASRYAIRKAHRPGQLSTLEATCAALAALEPNAHSQLTLFLAAFDGFVAQQQAWVPGR